MEKADFYDFFRKIPKAELHLHIEAVISFDSINKFYMRKFPGIGKDEAAREIKKLFTYDNLDGFIQAYLQVQELYESVADFEGIRFLCDGRKLQSQRPESKGRDRR